MHLPKGSHLKVRRLGYTHHGLYIGDNVVIHYLRDKGVSRASTEEFADSASIHIVDHSHRKYNSEESIDRALSRLGEYKYNLIFNNCEHFVNWCIDGHHSSEQINEAAKIALETTYRLYKEMKKNISDPVIYNAFSTNLCETDTIAKAIPSVLKATARETATISTAKTIQTIVGITTAASIGTTVAGGTGLVVGGITGVVSLPLVAPVALASAGAYFLSKLFDD